MIRLFSMLTLVLMPTQVFAYFKCTNEQGEISFQEFPCPTASSQTEERIRGEHKSSSLKPNSLKPNSLKPTKYHADQKSLSNQKFTEEFLFPEPESSVRTALILSKINSALASLSPLKAILTQYFADNGMWPENIEDIGLGDQNLTSSLISEVRLDADGVVIARLNINSEGEKYIALQPGFALGGTIIEWTCFANFTEQLLNSGGNGICESKVIN